MYSLGINTLVNVLRASQKVRFLTFIILKAGRQVETVLVILLLSVKLVIQVTIWVIIKIPNSIYRWMSFKDVLFVGIMIWALYNS